MNSHKVDLIIRGLRNAAFSFAVADLAFQGRWRVFAASMAIAWWFDAIQRDTWL